MATNRLQLDFSLTTNEERVAFIENYLQQPQFISRPPTADELEMIGNYLLWGKDPKTGLNAKQAGLVDIDTKHGTWDKNCGLESLDGLMEQPTFNEATLHPLDNAAPIKVKREVFSRKEALSKCPEYLIKTFNELFAQIDEIDLMINYYELMHGRRKNPPRDLLLNKFTEEQQAVLQEKVTHWNQYKYLKMRHELVELRREQYTLRDSYQQTRPSQEVAIYQQQEIPQLEADIEVLPLGVVGAQGYIFRKWE